MTDLDPTTRFSLAQIERAFYTWYMNDVYSTRDAADSAWRRYESSLSYQRGQYQHRRPGSNPGGYPKGRPRKSTREEE